MTRVRQRFLRKETKTQITKEKLDKFDLIIIQNFCYLNDTFMETQRPGENISEHMSDKPLVSLIYKQLSQLNNDKTNNPVKI